MGSKENPNENPNGNPNEIITEEIVKLSDLNHMDVSTDSETLENIEDPFKKSGLLDRTPTSEDETTKEASGQLTPTQVPKPTPRNETFYTPLSSTGGLAGLFKKRKADESPVIDSPMEEFLTTVQGMTKMIGALKGHMSRVTQKEIKKVTQTLVTLADRADILTDEIKTETRKKKGDVNRKEDEKNTNTRSKRSDEGDVLCVRCKTLVKNEEKEQDEIKKKLDLAVLMTDEEKTELVKKNWPETLFKNTKIRRGNPFSATTGQNDDDKITLIMGKSDKSTLIQAAITRYPELKTLMEEEEEEGELISSSVKRKPDGDNEKMATLDPDNKESPAPTKTSKPTGKTDAITAPPGVKVEQELVVLEQKIAKANREIVSIVKIVRSNSTEQDIPVIELDSESSDNTEYVPSATDKTDEYVPSSTQDTHDIQYIPSSTKEEQYVPSATENSDDIQYIPSSTKEEYVPSAAEKSDDIQYIPSSTSKKKEEIEEYIPPATNKSENIKYIPSSTNKVDELKYVPLATDKSDAYVPSSVNKIEESEYVPSSTQKTDETEYVPSSTSSESSSKLEYVPSSTEISDEKLEYVPSSTAQLEPNLEYVPSSTQKLEEKFDYVPSSTNTLEESLEYVPTSTEKCDEKLKYVPSSTNNEF
uniref:Uncharacterized protein n=1 Tax=Cacopsylla melanoneura TaxID=428564 RepID=A0A8D8M720_9HEMI